jgi:hypothetical protein
VDYIAMTDNARNQAKYTASTTPIVREAYLEVIGQ